jgi:glycosyltransferase involved in cell wall biosynthesis
MNATSSKVPRIVQVSFHADGARRRGDELLRAWPTLTCVAAAVARAGTNVTVVQTAHKDEVIRRDGVDFRFVRDTTRRLPRVVVSVAALRPDVVHVHGFHHGSAVMHLMRVVRGVPVLVQDHGGVPPCGWRRTAWRMSLGSIAGAAFTTREQAEPWVAAGVLPPNLPVFPVLGGSSSFTPGDQHEARRATGMFGDPCLLWTGRLDANKDPLMMLDAVERAAATLPGLRLWCCFGKAPLLEAVQARIAGSSTLRERVTLLGTLPVGAMEQHFRAADLYLQTSHREASGFSMLEALACGTPPLSTDIPAARRIVGDAGSLTPVSDASAFAAAIVEWSSRARTALRHAARRRFERALTYDAIAGDLQSAYGSLTRS